MEIRRVLRPEVLQKTKTKAESASFVAERTDLPRDREGGCCARENVDVGVDAHARVRVRSCVRALLHMRPTVGQQQQVAADLRLVLALHSGRVTAPSCCSATTTTVHA